jgi:hypothetical protein
MKAHHTIHDTGYVTVATTTTTRLLFVLRVRDEGRSYRKFLVTGETWFVRSVFRGDLPGRIPSCIE